MADENLVHYLRHSAGALGTFVSIAILLPLLLAFLLGESIPVTLALMGSTFAIEYGAAPVGIAGGLPPAFVLLVLSCIALGVSLLLFNLCEPLGEHSSWFARFLERNRKRAQASPLLVKYGIFSLVPLVMILGFYVCAPVAWVFGWQRSHALLLIMAGYLAACLVTILATMGLLGILLP